MGTAVLLSDVPPVGARILPLLQDAGLTVTLVAPAASHLRRSRFLDAFVPVPDETGAWPRTLRRVLDTTGDAWIVPLTDSMMWSILDGPLTTQEKLRLLPVGDEVALAALDSKIGMSQARARAGVRQPEFAVAHQESEVHEAARDLGYPVLVKEPRSGGGGGVQALTGPADPVRVPFGQGGRGLLVERFVPGCLVSMEALYRDGALRLLAVSEPYGYIGDFGVSVARRYVDCHDDGLVESLQRLGAMLGLDSFVNASAVRDPDGRYHVFEIDVRPNIWHTYLSGIGVDMSTALVGPCPHPVGIRLPSAPIHVRNLSRGAIHAASPRGWRTTTRLLAVDETLRHAHTRDPALYVGELLAFSQRLARHVRQGVRARMRRGTPERQGEAP